MSESPTTEPPLQSTLPVRWPRQQKLLEGRLIKRYKRFLADIELADGEMVTAHCVNTGAMEGLTTPGLRVWISRATNPKRKLAFTWELVECDGQIYGANTGEPNRIVRRLLMEHRLPWIGGYHTVRPEQPYGEKSRIDFLLEGPRRRCYLEVKNCHLVYPDARAYFPDSVSQRASGHLEELAVVAKEARNQRAEVLFVCQMPGVKAVRPSDVHDPTFAATARRVRGQGVRFSAIEVLHSPEAVEITRRVPVSLAPYGTKRVRRWYLNSRKS
ncbi:MAG: DNA/RNA nuclease SfsA [Acidobacteriota bacterium]